MVFGFLIMSSLLVILSVLAIFYTNRMQHNTHRILEENVSSLKAAEELEIALLDMKGLTANFLLNGDQKWLVEFSDKQASFLEWLEEARRRTSIHEEHIILISIDSLYQTYLSYQKQAVSGNRDERENSIKLLTQQMRDTFTLLYKNCEDLLFINEKLMYKTSLSIERDNRTVNLVMYGIGVAGVLLGISLGVILARSVTQPIYNLVVKLKGATSEEVIEQVELSEPTALENLDVYVKNLIDKVHQVNADLQKSQQMVILSEKLSSLGKMTAGLAHELRNPLTSIKMLIFSLQSEEEPDSKRVKDYEIIVKEIVRIEKLLQDFLDFARPPEPHRTWNDLNTIVSQTIDFMAPQFGAAKINVEKHLYPKAINVFVDREQFRQILVNLFLNSTQSMPDGGVLSVSIILDQTDRHDQAQVIIRDSGCGIPSEMLKTIFDPFITGKKDGTGLGLSIVHQIIHNHGGWIEAMNNSEGGATFIIYLPIEKRAK
jgi:signal transduction histidine kinase